ncbi:MAG: transcription termination factor NusA [Calditrichaeota bacterium]|nr:MAG: transcription termination factor NusA [Calditrichota bacterium]MBL1203900.1 transcription termination factor NusA [Calditrichota bacterium]NOG43733.1 transcription termination factor NusA [Calditrichota bacterium]
MNVDIMEAITQIAKDKKIEKEDLRDMLENIFRGMIQKRYGSDENFDVIVNIDKGDIEIYQEKTVVEDVEDPVREITLANALKIDEDAEMGEEIVEVIDPILFGRRLIVAAKQNLNQRIRDFEKENLIEEYENRIGEIIIGDIHQMHKRGMYINVDKTEVFLPRDEQIHNERLRRGNTIRCLIKEVRNTGRGPEIIVSRSDEQFLIRLFELEVPEIYDGIVEIKKVAREAGERSKISVESIDRRIDPVGACVGMKGVRIQSIVKELNNEKIDIISFSSEPEIFIMRAMTPAKPVKIIVNKDERMAVAVIPDDMMSLAIGRNGVNLRMASLLTDFQIEPIKESEYNTESSINYAATVIDDIEELAKSVKTKLIDAGLENIEDLAEKGIDGLKEIAGIGPKTVDKIWDVVQKYLDTEDED